MPSSSAIKLMMLLATFFATVAMAADNQSCTLCWEQAQNLAQRPICQSIFDTHKIEVCLCEPGNIETFRGCNMQCTNNPYRIPNKICAAINSKRDADPQIAALTPYKEEDKDDA